MRFVWHVNYFYFPACRWKVKLWSVARACWCSFVSVWSRCISKAFVGLLVNPPHFGLSVWCCMCRSRAVKSLMYKFAGIESQSIIWAFGMVLSLAPTANGDRPVAESGRQVSIWSGAVVCSDNCAWFWIDDFSNIQENAAFGIPMLALKCILVEYGNGCGRSRSTLHALRAMIGDTQLASAAVVLNHARLAKLHYWSLTPPIPGG